jgi:hypothetical protein
MSADMMLITNSTQSMRLTTNTSIESQSPHLVVGVPGGLLAVAQAQHQAHPQRGRLLGQLVQLRQRLPVRRLCNSKETC